MATSADRVPIVRRFAHAFARDDVDAMVALLTDGSWLAMPPAMHRYAGRTAVGNFLRASTASRPGGSYVLAGTQVGRRLLSFAVCRGGRVVCW
ncbi:MULTISPECIES: hypothetical protein [unclassified Paenarthrobacter]|uniref:hypothetical protein n=1 Tax=unclassified Paenarthrobacter TaxID=2634190 RepID=UPI0038075BE7